VPDTEEDSRSARSRRGQPDSLRSIPERNASLVSKWERGEKHPQGASLKLLSLVEKKGLEAVA
jgi:putative transcriptional regulator